MTEWAEGEDPDSYEIPKLEPDLPSCLKDRKRREVAPPLQSFAAPSDPSLNELVATTIELHQVSSSVERPTIDADFLDQEREFHSLDSPLPSVLLYFHAGDAVTRVFRQRMRVLGPGDAGAELDHSNPAGGSQQRSPGARRRRNADAGPGAHRSNQQDHRGTGEIQMRFSIDVGGELELKLYQAALLYRNSRREPAHGDGSQRHPKRDRRSSIAWPRPTPQHGGPA